MKNIILIGMPGSGKSTLGVLVAKALSMQFMDTDLRLQINCGSPLQNLVEEVGIERFLEIEEKCILSVDEHNTVIATGGSVALEEKAMQWLKKEGVVVFLNLGAIELNKRLTNISTRGIAMDAGDSIEALYERRMPFYQKWADVVIETEQLTIEETVEKVVSYALTHGIGNFYDKARS